jgi:hypothetical protein
VNAFIEMVKQFGMDEYEFAVREEKTYEVIEDVKTFRSEIGILYLNDFNRKVLTKLFDESDLEFCPLMDCGIYVYLWKGHPLANQIRWPVRTRSRSRNFRNIRVSPLNREIIIPSILPRKSSAPTAING